MTTAMPAVQIAGVGLLGPGLASWRQGAPLLRDPTLWLPAATVMPAPSSLPPTERRRAGASVKAALVVAEEAVAAAGMQAGSLPTVFTSSTGEPANCHALCEALASPGRLVSPTRFTNSVHNAPAGYWHIGAKSMQASTSLCAFDASFSAGLLEAVAQCATSHTPVLLVAFDVPYPEPLHRQRPVADIFGVALVLRPAAPANVGGDSGGGSDGDGDGDGDRDGANGPTLHLSLLAELEASTVCDFAPFESMRQHIPAARALPLLQRLASRQAGRVWIQAQPGLCLQVDLQFGLQSALQSALQSDGQPAAPAPAAPGEPA